MRCKALRRLLCAFGCHRYADVNLKTTFVMEDYNGVVYKQENRCIYCGKPYCELVKMNMRGT